MWCWTQFLTSQMNLNALHFLTNGLKSYPWVYECWHSDFAHPFPVVKVRDKNCAQALFYYPNVSPGISLVWIMKTQSLFHCFSMHCDTLLFHIEVICVLQLFIPACQNCSYYFAFTISETWSWQQLFCQYSLGKLLAKRRIANYEVF